MSIGGKGSSESKTNQTYDTDVFNQQVAASEGGQAIGSGSSGNVVNDASIISRAGDAIATVAGASLQANTIVTKDALGFGTEALGVVERTTQQANDILARSGETYAMRLQQNVSGEKSPESQKEDTTKYLIIGGAVLGLIYILKK